jgi:hypothetical protein
MPNAITCLSCHTSTMLLVLFHFFSLHFPPPLFHSLVRKKVTLLLRFNQQLASMLLGLLMQVYKQAHAAPKRSTIKDKCYLMYKLVCRGKSS